MSVSEQLHPCNKLCTAAIVKMSQAFKTDGLKPGLNLILERSSVKALKQ